MMTSMKSACIGLFLLLTGTSATTLAAQKLRQVDNNYPGILVEQLYSGLSIPWGMTFLSPHQLLITERAGKVHLLNTQNISSINISGIPEVIAEGQGGMMDVAIGPNYLSEGWIYFTYSKPSKGKAATTLARAHLEQNHLVDWQDLLVTDSATNTGRHFGSRIAFDDKGHIFFSVGDRGERAMAQDLSNHMGSIIRLNLDGSIPDDNPFVGYSKARAEIFSYGHRNPQGLLFDQISGRLWSIEHGPRGGDEINLIEKGLNYGWPVISHGKEYWGPVAVGEGTSKPGMEQPRKVYIPSIAPGSLMLYRGDAFPAWQGNLFTGALKLTHLNRIELSQTGHTLTEERILEELHERIRALIESPNGWIYFSTDSGRILRIRPTS